MPNSLISLIILSICTWLAACAPIKSPMTNQYTLEAYSTQRIKHSPSRHTILISQPAAVAGYQTEQMLYVEKPFAITAFTNNSWLSPPADMLYALILQSTQQLGYFYAVSSSLNSEPTDYRLDTQLIKLQQNFLVKPSRIELVIKVVLTYVPNNQVISARIMKQYVPCLNDTPYGGVQAANVAVKQFTRELATFITKAVKRH